MVVMMIAVVMVVMVSAAVAASAGAHLAGPRPGHVHHRPAAPLPLQVSALHTLTGFYMLIFCFYHVCII
jgi:hypothetical protein